MSHYLYRNSSARHLFLTFWIIKPHYQFKCKRDFLFRNDLNTSLTWHGNGTKNEEETFEKIFKHKNLALRFLDNIDHELVFLENLGYCNVLKFEKLISPVRIFSVSDMDVYITDPISMIPDFQTFIGMYYLL